MSTSTYQSPVITELGSVEDLTQVTIAVKSSRNGTDIHFSKNGVKAVGGKRGVSVDLS